MKIEVAGTCIETKDILRITKIEESNECVYLRYTFRIIFTNNESFYIHGDYISINNIDFESLEPEYSLISPEKIEKAKDEAFKKLSSLRNKIIKVWSDNQLEIPQFNL